MAPSPFKGFAGAGRGHHRPPDLGEDAEFEEGETPQTAYRHPEAQRVFRCAEMSGVQGKSQLLFQPGQP